MPLVFFSEMVYTELINNNEVMMMTTVEEVILKAKDLADAAGKKTGDLVQLTKLKLEAAETEKAISLQLEKIGRLVYAAHKSGESVEEELAAPYAELEQLEQKAEEIADKMDVLRCTRHCTACGQNNAAGAVYCQNCGEKL